MYKIIFSCVILSQITERSITERMERLSIGKNTHTKEMNHLARNIPGWETHPFFFNYRILHQTISRSMFKPETVQIIESRKNYPERKFAIDVMTKFSIQAHKIRTSRRRRREKRKEEKVAWCSNDRWRRSEWKATLRSSECTRNKGRSHPKWPEWRNNSWLSWR